MKKGGAIEHFSITLLSFLLFFLFTSQKPVNDSLLKESFIVTGKASYYANMLDGLNTSSGDLYNKNDFTCAHRTLPFNTLLRVTNIATGKNAIVRVNDRGPYKKGRLIDLSRAAALKLGMMKNGIAKVKITALKLPDALCLHDSLLHNGDVLNSDGNREQMDKKNIIKVWSTPDLKHALYMATDIKNDYTVDCVYIKVYGEGDSRRYSLYIPGAAKKEETNNLIVCLKEDGFFQCRYIKK